MTDTQKSERRARVAAVAAGLLGLSAWIAVGVATAVIPSPARELRVAGGAHASERLTCHGIYAVDGEDVWAVCDVRSAAPDAQSFVTRMRLADGTATLLGPLAEPHSGLGAIARVPGGVVLLADDDVVLVQGETLRMLGEVVLPLGLASVDGAIEVAAARGDGADVQRFVEGGATETRHIALERGPERDLTVQRAFHDERGWHVVYLEHAGRAASLPVEVRVLESIEGGAARELGTHMLGEPSAMLTSTGELFVHAPFFDGAVLRGWIGTPELFVRRGERFEAIAFEQSYVQVMGAVLTDEPRPRLLVMDTNERRGWLDGTPIERVEHGRFDAIRVGDRVGPPVVSAFWIGIGFHLLPDGRGGYWALGGLGEARVHLDADLERTDGLSFFERFGRLFVEDRAKRNVDYFQNFGVLRSLTVPWLLAGPLVALLCTLLARRRAALASALGWSWVVVAVLAVYEFQHLVRYYW